MSVGASVGAWLGGSGGGEGTTRVDARRPWSPAASVSAHSPRQSRCSARQQRTSKSRHTRPDRKVGHMCHLLDPTSGLFLCHAGLAATTNPQGGCHGCHSVRECTFATGGVSQLRSDSRSQGRFYK